MGTPMSNTLQRLFKLDHRPSLTIEKNGDPYLTRWWLTSKTHERHQARKWLPGILLHHIWRPDEDRAPHSHPWWFVSVVLKGFYVENRYNQSGRWNKRVVRNRFSIAFRRAADLHEIAVVSPDLWTLVLAGPKRREWGFMTPNGWVHWENYVYAGDSITTTS